ncbi:MAG: HDOD domain-containing protein [Planctomycetota bacterium]
MAGVDTYEIPALKPRLMQLASVPAGHRDYLELILDGVMGDPALTGEAFRMANSPVYRGNRRCTSLRQCVMRVGPRAYVSHVLKKYFVSVFSPASAVNYELWQHSMLVASANRFLARMFSHLSITPEWAFLMGIMHNIGSLVLAHNAEEKYTEVVQGVSLFSSRLLDVERSTFGTDHQELGEVVAGSWGLPADVVAVMASHHANIADLEGTPHRDCVLLTQLGLSMTVAYYEDPDEAAADPGRPATHEIANALGLRPPDETWLAESLLAINDEAQVDLQVILDE